jgi:outer membrane PBP1 activator LpoA protein
VRFPPVTSHRYRLLVRQALFDATATPSPTREQIVLAFNDLCDRLIAVLEPLFGGPAVEALFARAGQLAAREFPAISTALAKGEARCRVDALNDSSPSEAADMLAALLAHKIELLITFVGEDLVMPLIRRAWPAVAARNVTNNEAS